MTQNDDYKTVSVAALTAFAKHCGTEGKLPTELYGLPDDVVTLLRQVFNSGVLSAVRWTGRRQHAEYQTALDAAQTLRLQLDDATVRLRRAESEVSRLRQMVGNAATVTPTSTLAPRPGRYNSTLPTVEAIRAKVRRPEMPK